jgi:hypothetical protein
VLVPSIITIIVTAARLWLYLQVAVGAAEPLHKPLDETIIVKRVAAVWNDLHFVALFKVSETNCARLEFECFWLRRRGRISFAFAFAFSFAWAHFSVQQRITRSFIVRRV